VLFDNIGGSELFVVMLVIFIFFGPKKFPEMGKSIGKAMREFKSAMRGVKEDLEKSTRIEP
jgi:sec-independent protein translocase protein TatA